MRKFGISRRGVLKGTSLLLASTALPGFAFAQETPKKGGRLIVAADSEPRNLNPAIVASNGVFFLSQQGRRAAGRSLLRRRRRAGRRGWRQSGKDRPTG